MKLNIEVNYHHFDVPKLIPTKMELQKENFKLMDHISDRGIFRKTYTKTGKIRQVYKINEREGYS